MGQRSQIYIHYNVKGNEGLIARYFQWNYGERMISRARGIMELIKDELLQYELFSNEEKILKLIRFCDINFDMRDVVLSVDILDRCREYDGFSTKAIFGEANNDGQLLIDVTDNGIKYCFLEYYDEIKPMSAEQYMKWNTETEENSDWHIPDEYMDEETIGYTERNIEYINFVAKLMTEKEAYDFINYDYETLFKGENRND